MFDKGQRTTVMTKFKEIQDAVPWDSLRDGIMTLSQDPEAFIGIRQMAAMSLAVFSIGSYIIGIGDRHLDNFLLNLTKYGPLTSPAYPVSVVCLTWLLN
jgi:DNA-dependent protein kinase catalytic subunit